MADKNNRSAESVIRMEHGLESTDTPQNRNEREPVKVYGRPNAKGYENLRNPMKLGTQGGINCEATKSADGHSGKASHIFSFEDGHPESDVAVCSAHLPKLIKGSIRKGELNFNHRPIESTDVAPLKALRAIHSREVIEPYESMLSSKGVSKADSGIGIGADAERPGKGGPHGKKIQVDLNKKDHVSEVIETAQTHGGHPPLKATGGHYDEKGRVYTFPKKSGPRGVAKPKPSKENPEVTEEEIAKMPPAFAAISRQTKAERKAAGIPVTGIVARGLSKTNNRTSIGSVVNRATPVKNTVSGFESFVNKRIGKQEHVASKEAEASTEAKRLRSIEAKKSEHQGVKRASRSNEFGTGRVADPSAQVTKGGTVSGVNTDIEALTRKLLGE